MNTMTFDTHAVIKRLVATGMPENQAEAVTALVQEAQEGAVSGLATKADIADVKRDIAETKADLLKWVFGALAAQTALLSAIKFFGH